jgi:hypothetical protein
MASSTAVTAPRHRAGLFIFEGAKVHDRNGTPLKKGDLVLIPAVITELQAGEDYCNVSLQTVSGRRPDGLKEYISAINTGVLVLSERPAEVAP